MATSQSNTHRRGIGEQLTQKITKDTSDVFKNSRLTAFRHMFPIYVLLGIKNPSDDRDKYQLAERFMYDGWYSHQQVLNALYKYQEYVQKEGYVKQDVIDVIWTGTERIQEHESHFLFSETNRDLLRRHRIDFMKVSKYMFYGFENRDWYKDTLKAFKSELGGYDLELFIKLFALTSPRANFKSNLTFAFRAYDLMEKGRNFRGKGFIPAVATMLEDFRLGDFDFKANPRGGRRKVVAFYKAIIGKKDSVVVDTHLLHAYGIQDYYEWKGKRYPYKPRVSEYDLVEAHIRHLSEAFGYEPRQIVSMLWSGIRIAHAKQKEASTKILLQSILQY
jgi:hypothetical protein